MKNTKETGPLTNILFSIVIPVFILNKISGQFGDKGPLIALIIALAFPVGLGIFDLIRTGKKNFISLLGIVNVLLTGGLALYRLEGIWFAVKEASVPLIIGIAVTISAFTKQGLLEFLILNDNLFKVDLIKKRVKEFGQEKFFKNHLKKSTLLLSGSFYLSALLNFVLAKKIFTKIDPTISETQKAIILNDQIAQMTWKSYIVIMVPSMAALFFIMWYLFKGIRESTQLTLQDVVRNTNPE